MRTHHMAGGSISNFEYIVEAMPFPTEEERIVYAIMLCRNLGGIQLSIPRKQHERVFAKALLEKGVDFSDVKEIVFLHEVTIKKIQKEVHDEQKH